MKRLPIPTLILPVLLVPALSACALTATTSTVQDPIFAPGQQWLWLDQPLTLPDREFWFKDSAVYRIQTHFGPAIQDDFTFEYRPAGQLAAYAAFKDVQTITNPSTRLPVSWVRGCLVRQPTPVKVNEELSGMPILAAKDAPTAEFPGAREYLQTGRLPEGKACTMKRVK